MNNILCNLDSCLQKDAKTANISCPPHLASLSYSKSKREELVQRQRGETVACVHNTYTVVSNGITFFQLPFLFLSESKRQSAPCPTFLEKQKRRSQPKYHCSCFTRPNRRPQNKTKNTHKDVFFVCFVFSVFGDPSRKTSETRRKKGSFCLQTFFLPVLAFCKRSQDI